jgi:hypothetical protein
MHWFARWIAAVRCSPRARGIFAAAALVLVGCQQTTEPSHATVNVAEERDEVIQPLPKAAENAGTGAPRTRFPLFEPFLPEAAALERLAQDPVAAQPWLRSSKRPPLSLQDLGLKGPLHLADFSGTKLEWGTHVVVADAHGNLFAFASRERRRAIDDYVDSFYLGGLEPDSRLVRVDEGTPSYKFLQALVWHFADDPRYRARPATLQRVKEMLHVSDAEFAELLQPPAWP